MRLIVLAAGYATRLYPLTLNQPKPLLEVAGKPIIEHLLDNLLPTMAMEHVYVITNDKFASHFRKWLERYRASRPGVEFTVVNDRSTDESNKLGAIGDLYLTLTQERIDDDIVVVAGDNLFGEKLHTFGEFCREKRAPVLAVYDVGDLNEIKKYNAIEVDESGRITFFEEKPQHPKSTLTGIALYYYPASALPLIHRYVEEGNNPDQPGFLVQWMYRRVPFYVWPVPGLWYDVGSAETLEEVNRTFSGPAAHGETPRTSLG